MNYFVSVLGALVAAGCALVRPAQAPPAPVVLQVNPEGAGRATRFAVIATGGPIHIVGDQEFLVAEGARLEASAPATVVLGEGVSAAGIVALGSDEQVRVVAFAPEGTAEAHAHRVRFERNAERMGVRTW